MCRRPWSIARSAVQGLAVHASANGWWLLAAVGGLLALVAGVLTVFDAGSGPRLGAKYDAPSAPDADEGSGDGRLGCPRPR